MIASYIKSRHESKQDCASLSDLCVLASLAPHHFAPLRQTDTCFPSPSALKKLAPTAVQNSLKTFSLCKNYYN